LKVIFRPEVAVALTVNGGAPYGWFDSAPKSMVWLNGVTWKVWSTGAAAV
jgi:hypothetical protein